jgi:hypothetical protein
MMEVYAGFQGYTLHQFSRVTEYIKEQKIKNVAYFVVSTSNAAGFGDDGATVSQSKGEGRKKKI